MTARKKAPEQQTTQARLSSIIKESRNIMRKDAGLNGELDRLPQLAWLLFLKAFDDLEEQRAVSDSLYGPVVPDEFRWTTWASKGNLTGEPLLAFVNGKLLPHLAQLQGNGRTGDPRDTLARVFKDLRNRMVSGYLLRELVDQLDRVQFANADDIHTMAHLYESMLKEMRDAAGDSGEFYTPRPLVRFIVDRMAPKPYERVLDPACGTGGFLVEAFEHMRREVSTAAELEAAKRNVRGIEKKSMPHLLAQMNLLLHGIEEPNVVVQNSLAFELAKVKADGADVVLSNPPFGGEEEASIQRNFPTELRTNETAWLFVQSIMARIAKSKSGRAAIVVPNSVLFDRGVGGRIKKKLMSDFNLHTVLRLPNGVFAPYTLIPSNVLFFDLGPQQQDVWFYEQTMPEGRKNYTKTKPMRFEEFGDCAAWWGGEAREGRVENERAWAVKAAAIEADGFNLDQRNPHRPEDLAHRPPAELIAELIATEREILSLLEDLKRGIAEFAK